MAPRAFAGGGMVLIKEVDQMRLILIEAMDSRDILMRTAAAARRPSMYITACSTASAGVAQLVRAAES